MLPSSTSGPCTNDGSALYEWDTTCPKDTASSMPLLDRSPFRPPTRRLSALALVAAAGRLAATVLLLVLVTGRSAEAQNVRVGARAGPTFGFLSDNAVPFTGNDAAINANLRLDFHVGAYAIVPVTDYFALQPELLYVQKGGHFSRPRSESYAVERYRLSYAEGALLGRHDFSIPGPLSLHAIAGLSVDVALGGAVRRNVRTTEIDVGERVGLLETGQLRRWDVGALFGVGFGYRIGAASRASLDIRYNPGFRSVFRRPAHSADAPPDGIDDLFPLTSSSLRHDVITASLSYTLPLASLF